MFNQDKWMQKHVQNIRWCTVTRTRTKTTMTLLYKIKILWWRDLDRPVLAFNYILACLRKNVFIACGRYCVTIMPSDLNMQKKKRKPINRLWFPALLSLTSSMVMAHNYYQSILSTDSISLMHLQEAEVNRTDSKRGDWMKKALKVH